MSDPTNIAGTEVRLLVERPDGWSVLPVHPDAPSVLLVGADKVSLHSAVRQNVGDVGEGLLLEVVAGALSPRLLAVPHAGQGRLHVNGQPAPVVALLRAKDVFYFEHSDAAFHVTTFHRVRIGQADPSQVGKECPVCRSALTAESRVLTCPCGTGIHLADDEAGLRCALAIRSCPACGRKIELEDSYSFLPEGFPPEEVAA
jgi:hypothetical protein